MSDAVKSPRCACGELAIAGESTCGRADCAPEARAPLFVYLEPEGEPEEGPDEDSGPPGQGH